MNPVDKREAAFSFEWGMDLRKKEEGELIWGKPTEGKWKERENIGDRHQCCYFLKKWVLAGKLIWGKELCIGANLGQP